MKMMIDTKEEQFYQEICEAIRFFEPEMMIERLGNPQGATKQVKHKESKKSKLNEADCAQEALFLACGFTQDRFAYANIQKGEKNVRILGDFVAEYREEIMQKRMDKRALKLALYRALSAIFEKKLPWGALTGVRPTKLALSFLKESGQQEAQRIFTEDFFVSQPKTKLTFDTIAGQQAILDSAKKTDFDLYIGIPFCPTRCAYCSFGAYEISRHQESIAAYCHSLQQEIRRNVAQARQANYCVRSIYIGGGTPTALASDQLRDIIRAAVESCGSYGLELTVEAGRPETLNEDMLSMLKASNVTRISINPQSFNQKTLELIGRAHTVAQTVDAFHLARVKGFDNINMDVILALPGEDLAMVEHTFAEIEKLSPESLTVHTLAIKRTSKFKDSLDSLAFAPIEQVEAMIDLSHISAKKMGMQPYYLYRQKYMRANLENVGYSKPQKQSVYNVDIMEESTNILACGAGAISKWIYTHGKVIREPNPIELKTYFDKQELLAQKKKRMMVEV